MSDGPTDVAPAPPAPLTEGGLGRWWLLGALIAVLVVAGGFVGLIAATSGSDTTSVTYTIPAGSSARIDRGEKLTIVPANLTLAKGSELVLVNQDRATFSFGTITIGPGQVMRTRFPTPGTFRNTCTLNPESAVTIFVV